MGFCLINQPFWGYPHLWKPPYGFLMFPPLLSATLLVNHVTLNIGHIIGGLKLLGLRFLCASNPMVIHGCWWIWICHNLPIFVASYSHVWWSNSHFWTRSFAHFWWSTYFRYRTQTSQFCFMGNPGIKNALATSKFTISIHFSRFLGSKIHHFSICLPFILTWGYPKMVALQGKIHENRWFRGTPMT